MEGAAAARHRACRSRKAGIGKVTPESNVRGRSMKRKYISISMAILAGAMAVGFSCGSRAQVTSNDDFTQANDTNSWKTFDGACLTAGDGTGSIPPCVGLAYYKNQV